MSSLPTPTAYPTWWRAFMIRPVEFTSCAAGKYRKPGAGGLVDENEAEYLSTSIIRGPQSNRAINLVVHSPIEPLHHHAEMKVCILELMSPHKLLTLLHRPSQT